MQTAQLPKATVNRVILVGNLGRDMELRYMRRMESILSFLVDDTSFMSGEVKKPERLLAGLSAQDEPPQYFTDFFRCPNCCLISLLGPPVRGPPWNGERTVRELPSSVFVAFHLAYL